MDKKLRFFWPLAGWLSQRAMSAGEPEEAGASEAAAKLFYERPDGENEEATLGEVQALVARGAVNASTRVWTASLGESWMSLEAAVAAGKIRADFNSAESRF